MKNVWLAFISITFSLVQPTYGVTPIWQEEEAHVGESEIIYMEIEEPEPTKSYEAKKVADALFKAVENSDIESVKKALQGGTDVNSKDNYGNTALIYANYDSHIEIVKLLIEAKADVNAKNNYGETALLIEAGADVNAIDEDDGSTALLWATRMNKNILYDETVEVVKLLIEAGVDVNARREDGSTALIEVAKGWHHRAIEMVKLLIEAKADVNAKDNDGETALMKAAGNGQSRIVKLLIEAKADVNAKDNDGRTALKNAGDEIGYLLKKAGAKE